MSREPAPAGSSRPARLPKLAVTCGEPAGIGPELVALLAATPLAADLVAIGDAGLLSRAAQRRGIALKLEGYDGQPRPLRATGTLRVLEVPLRAVEIPGQPDPRNAFHVLQMLARAVDGCLDGEFDALVTAPVQKSVINDAGERFTGHTELLAARAGCEVVMMLASPNLRVALATTHLPLAGVPAAITRDSLVRTLRIVHAELIRKFGIHEPRIAVLGLNPHAGEGGHLGREEIDCIAPALDALRGEGMRLLGPLPADTAFVPDVRARYDAVLAMYHDQALPVLKAEAFDRTVNITLGLPFIRTSVDHGTALDIAGTGRADPSSMLAAADMALQLVNRHPQSPCRSAACARSTTAATLIAGMARSHGELREPMRPKKHFGQHFLRDHSVVERIVAAIAPHPGDRIVEIGPGEGALTLPLLRAAGRLTAIELDADLIEPLRARAAVAGELDVINADVLDVDFAALAGGGRLRLAGNLPYYVSSPILFHCLTHSSAITDMHFMLQREVVDRMAAAPGTKVYGRLSVMLQLACKVEPLLTVAPGAFRPPPKVDSAVVRLTPLPAARRPDPSLARALDAVVRAGFGQRRKTLANALRGLVDADVIRAAGIDPGARAETVGPPGFVALAQSVNPARLQAGPKLADTAGQ